MTKYWSLVNPWMHCVVQAPEGYHIEHKGYEDNPTELKIVKDETRPRTGDQMMPSQIVNPLELKAGDGYHFEYDETTPTRCVLRTVKDETVKLWDVWDREDVKHRVIRGTRADVLAYCYERFPRFVPGGLVELPIIEVPSCFPSQSSCPKSVTDSSRPASSP